MSGDFERDVRDERDGQGPAQQNEVERAQEVYSWARSNIYRYDVTGDNRLNFNELTMGIGAARNDKEAGIMQDIQGNYDRLKRQNPGAFGGHKDSISLDDLAKDVEVKQQAAFDREQARLAQARMAAQQEQSRETMRPLLSTDNGHPNRSLFKVIDGLGRMDDKVGKGDLDKYLKEYNQRARIGDTGYGFFTEENRDYVQYLRDNWDRPEVVALRGTTQYRDSNNEIRTETNRNMTPESLRAAAGMPQGSNVYEPYVVRQRPGQDETVRAIPGGSSVSGEGDQRRRGAEPSRVAQASLEEPAADPRQGEQRRVVTDGQRQPVVDGQRQPVVQGDPQLRQQGGEPVVRRQDGAPDQGQRRQEIQPDTTQRRQQGGEPVVRRPDGALDQGQRRQVEQEGADMRQQGRHDMQRQGDMRAQELPQRRYRPNEAEQQFQRRMWAAEDAANRAAHLSQWGRENFSRFDITGDNRLNYGELDYGYRTARRESDAQNLASIQDNYNYYQQHNRNFLFGRKESISLNDLADDAQRKREQSEEMYAQAESRAVMKPLLETPNGHPNHSLFKAIDSMDGDIDGQIEKRDLERYMERYQRRSRHDDVGRGPFSDQARGYVQYLLDNWDSPQMIRLRGTRYDHNERKDVPSWYITEDKLKKAGGLHRSEDLYSLFRNPERDW